MPNVDAPKRVLIFSTAYFPHVGGAEVAIKEITDRIDGYEFDLICARYGHALPAKERIGTVTVYRVGWGIRLLDKLISPFWGALLAMSLDSKRHYDAFWAMMATYGSGGAYITNMLRRHTVPIVLTLQEGDPPEYLRRKWLGLLALSWRLALARSAAVTVISTYLGKLAREFGYKGDPILIPNGVDLARFAREFSQEEITAQRESLWKKDGEVFLITSSRLVKKNAVDDVIHALTLLPPNVSFLICGTGPDETMLKERAKEFQLGTRVRFLGHVEHEKLPRLLRASDIFIRPSRSEGMGNSFVEAMAAGIPVIATQVGGLKDFLFDERRNPGEEPTGFAVDVDSPKQIAEAVLRIMNDRAATARVVASARALVIARYGWDRIAGEMKDVFNRVVSGQKEMP